jgi:uncharacterized protein YndB with AHSA1/START domain
MCLGAVYGTVLYPYFSYIAGAGIVHGSGQMLLSFLVGVPFVIGIITGFLAKRRRLAGFAGAGVLSTLSVALFVFAAGALLREGTICIAMAIPLILIAALIGAIAGVFMDSAGGPHAPKLLSLALVVPLVGAPLEGELPTDTAKQAIDRSIYIAARPEVVWFHINYPVDIKPGELSGGLAYRIGVPYPIEARTMDARVGGKRELRWQRGISFQETITDWVPNRYIAWKYDFQPNSFPPGSLDDHILIGGRYFNLEDTSYTLVPEGTGTRLRIHVATSVTTNFNWYAGMWAHFLIGDTAETILEFYKHRAESVGA